MPTSFEQLIINLRNKSSLLQVRYEQLQKGIASRDERIAALEKELETARRENSKLRQQIEYLQVVHSVTPNREEIEQTRTLLTGLVREIDKCIADLSD